MARRSNSTGISPGGKAAILLVVFGIPLLFAGASIGLDWLFNTVPVVAIGFILIIATAYTAHTSGLLYRYYEVDPPILRFVPCLCEVTLIDRKFHTVCYILYAVSVLFAIIAFLPYEIASVLGQTFVEKHTFWFGMLALLVLLAIQVVKGIGIAGCIKDVSEDWYQQTHSDVGLIKRFSPLGFIPFVRVVALYSLNKPLDTMVEFMEVSVSDAGETDQFYEEEYDD